jgi:hypothetical protein
MPANRSIASWAQRFQLADPAQGRRFWEAYRNGLLHHVATQTDGKGKRGPPRACLTHDIPEAIQFDAAGGLYVHPERFAKRVMEVIEGDFGSYAGSGPHQSAPMRESVCLGPEGRQHRTETSKTVGADGRTIDPWT